MAQSITEQKSRKAIRKPDKPRPDFPLFAHGSGRWAKKIRKRLHYFGRWATTQSGVLVPADDIEGSARKAEEQFNLEWPYLREGREVPPGLTADSLRHVADSDFCTMEELCNKFWNSKRSKMLSGELSQRSFKDYELTTDLLIAHFGKERRVDDIKPEEFRSLREYLTGVRKLGVHSLKNTINRCRIVFRFAHENGLIEKRVNYGDEFDRPSAKAMRKARNESGPRLFERDELLSILDASDAHLKAMILLGINCGFGNTDVSSLPQSAVDLENGWVDFPRPKTEIPRRCKLWPETVDALKAAIASRPEPEDKADADLCFVTNRGNPWVRVREVENGTSDAGETLVKFVHIDALTQKFGNTMRRPRCPECGTLQSASNPDGCESCEATPAKWGHINGRKGLGFYTLRHNFETIGGKAKDQVAVNAIMGHVDGSMAGVYRERISDERLETVSETVRQWLFKK